MTRALASIRTVADTQPIEDADRIEVVAIDGWKVVARKDEFKTGDRCVYFEIDSFLPIQDEFEFLRKSCFRSVQGLGDGFRLRTIKLRKQISQGLVMPIHDLLPARYKSAPDGTDVTKMLGVVLWEPPIPTQLQGKVRGNYPSFIHKTDQDRIQNCLKDFRKDWIDHIFETSVKLDGSSMTVFYNEGDFGVCSRNMDLAETEGNSFWQVANMHNLRAKLTDLGMNVAIQGELMGPGVQGNRENLKEIDMYVFDIYDIDNQRYMPASARMSLVHVLGLKHVPLIEQAIFSGFEDVGDFMRYTDRPSLHHSIAEGVVFKSIQDPDVSFKVINDGFLLKEKD